MKTYKKLFAATILAASIFVTQSAKSNDSFDKKYNKIILSIMKSALFKIHGVKNFEEFQKHYRSLINLTLLREKNANCCINEQPLIFFATSINNVNLVKKLISMGASVNSKTKFGETPLILLIFSSLIFKFDPTQLAELLIKHGASPKAGNYQGKNAIETARYLCSDKMLKVFKKYGYC